MWQGERESEDVLSLILDYLVFFIFVAQCPFSRPLLPDDVSLPVTQHSRERTNMGESGCAPGCAGILGFVKFRRATYSKVTEGGRFGGGGGGRKLWIGFTARAEIHGTRDL